MAGLLDFLSSDDAQLGLGLLSAAGPRMDGAGFGQRLQEGMGYVAAQKEAAMKRAFMQSQIDENRAQVAEKNNALDKQRWMQDTAQKYYTPAQSAQENALATGAANGSTGPTLANALRVPMGKATEGGFDQKGFIQAVMQRDPMAGMKMQEEYQKSQQQVLLEGSQVFNKDTGKVMYGNAPKPMLQHVPDTDYRSGGVFDQRTGMMLPFGRPAGMPPPAAPGMPGPQGGQMLAPASPQGIPQDDPNAPWRGMPPKVADELRSKIYESESAKLKALSESVTAGRRTMAQFDAFGGLNRNTATGGFADKLPEFLTTNSDKQSMLAIQNGMAPGLRAPGSGSSSDTDIRMLKSGIPGIDKTGDVNKGIRDRYSNLLQDDEKELAFKQNYLRQFGHLSGVEASYDAAKGQQAAPGTPANPTAPPAKPVTVTGNGKMLSGEKRAALDMILQSNNPAYLAQARAKGWIE